MIFITKIDIEQKITAGLLSLITGDDDTLLDTAETTAIGTVTDMLTGMYDLAAELTKTGSDRHSNFKKWILALCIYELYAHIPDNELPERVVKDYDDTLGILSKIAQGKLSTTLQAVTNDDGTVKRVVRYGFSVQRNHDI